MQENVMVFLPCSNSAVGGGLLAPELFQGGGVIS